MGAIDALFDVGILALNAGQYAQLRQMKEMGQTAAIFEAIRSLARDYLFHANQLKEDLLYYRLRNPVAVASGLAYLGVEIQESGITPGLFDALSDKEYYASLVRGLRQNEAELLESFSLDQQQMARQVAQALQAKEELDYLVDAHDDAVALGQYRNQLARLDLNRPPGSLFGGGVARRDWDLNHKQLERDIRVLEPVVNEKRWAYLSSKYAGKSKEDFQSLQAQVEQLITSTFGTIVPPQLSLGDLLVQGNDNSSAVSTIEFKGQSPGAQLQPKSHDRKPCPNCGYENSKDRVTCKRCRWKL